MTNSHLISLQALSRGFLEAATLAAYIQYPTQRVLDTGTITLSVDDKVKLFEGFRYIQQKKIGRFSKGDRIEYDKATAFRRSLFGPKVRNKTWHESDWDPILDEILALGSSPDQRQFIDMIQYQLKMLSYMGHVNPVPQLYFSKTTAPDGRACDTLNNGFVWDELLWGSIVMANFVLVRWALDISPAGDEPNIQQHLMSISQPLFDQVP